MKSLWQTRGLMEPSEGRETQTDHAGENGIVRQRATAMDEVWRKHLLDDRTADGRHSA
jgi:hypothetical protein